MTKLCSGLSALNSMKIGNILTVFIVVSPSSPPICNSPEFIILFPDLGAFVSNVHLLCSMSLTVGLSDTLELGRGYSF